MHYFSRFFTSKVRGTYTWELYNEFHSGYMSHYIWYEMNKSKLHLLSKLLCFMLLLRNIHWSVCLFIIFFLFMWTYFHHKLLLCKFCVLKHNANYMNPYLELMNELIKSWRNGKTLLQLIWKSQWEFIFQNFIV